MRVVAALVGVSFLVGAVQAVVAGDVRLLVVDALLTGLAWWPLVTSLLHRDLDEAPVAGEPEDLRSRGLLRWVLPVAVLAVVGVLGLVPRPLPSIVPVCALLIAATMVVRMRTGGDEVDFEEDALVVRTRTGRERRYPWADVLELSWSSPLPTSAGSGPVARVRGTAFDSPGPTTPAQVAVVLLAGHASRRWGRDQVRRAAARHGIPFTDDLIAAVNSGRRSARLPGETS